MAFAWSVSDNGPVLNGNGSTGTIHDNSSTRCREPDSKIVHSGDTNRNCDSNESVRSFIAESPKMLAPVVSTAQSQHSHKLNRSALGNICCVVFAYSSVCDGSALIHSSSQAVRTLPFAVSQAIA